MPDVSFLIQFNMWASYDNASVGLMFLNGLEELAETLMCHKDMQYATIVIHDAFLEAAE